MSKYSIDEVNLYQQLGHDKFVELSTRFYGKVYADTEPAFRGMFPKDQASAIQNQYEFLIQRTGGPELYSQRKGHPALRARHPASPRTHGGAWTSFSPKWPFFCRMTGTS